jgi:hypothetical protein
MRNFFTDHPASVGETYWQHLGVALSFAGSLFAAAFAALVHAIFPAWFEKTASAKITLLHDRMVCNRKRQNTSTDALSQTQLAETHRLS